MWFIFQKTKYVYDGEKHKTFAPVEFPVDRSVREYMDWKGYQEEEELKAAQKKFDKNS